MAKKVVATLQTAKGKNFVKLIRAIRSPKTGSYTFKEQIVPLDQVQAMIAEGTAQWLLGHTHYTLAAVTE